MQEAFLDRLSYSLGDEALSVDEEHARGRLSSPANVIKEAGFAQHYACREGTSAYDLSKRAVEKIKNDLGAVDAIVYASMFPVVKGSEIEQLLDFPAARLQVEFGLKGAQIFGVNQQACAGSLAAIRFARALLLAEPEIGRILCVSSDRFPEGAHYERHYNLISDGAAAFLMSRNKAGFRVLACHSVVDGSLISGQSSGSMGGLSHARESIEGVLAKANRSINDVRWIVGENTIPKLWQFLSRAIRCRFEQVYIPSLPEIGHAISADSIVNLKRLRDEGKVSSGDKILLFASGFDHIWQSVLLETV